MIFNEFLSINYGDFDGTNEVSKIFFSAHTKEKQIFLYGYKIKEPGNKTKLIVNKIVGELTDCYVITDNVEDNLIFTKDGVYSITLSNNSIIGAPKLIDCKINVQLNNDTPEIPQEEFNSIMNSIKDISYEMYKRISMGIESRKKLNESTNKEFSVTKTDVVSTYLFDMLMTNQEFNDLLSFNDPHIKKLVSDAFFWKAALNVDLYNLLLALKTNKAIIENNQSNNVVLLKDYLFLIRRAKNQPFSFFKNSLKTINAEKMKEITISKKEDNYKQIISDALLQFTRINYIELYVDGEKVLATEVVPMYQDDILLGLSKNSSIFFQGAMLGTPKDKSAIIVDTNNSLGLSVGDDGVPSIYYKKDEKYDRITTENVDVFERKVTDNRIFLLKIYNKVLTTE